MIRLLILAAAALLLQAQPALAQDGCAPDSRCDVACVEPTEACRPGADHPPSGAVQGDSSIDGGADAPAEAPFVASRLGRVFYAVKCGAWRALVHGNLLWFSAAAEARAAGYEPSRSSGCAPPAAAPRSPTPSAASAPASTNTCVLQRVVDGDTVLCRGGTRIRLLLIDTPEMDQGQYGREARQYVVELVPRGTALRVTHDVVRQDRYGRTLAYLFLPDGRMLNEEIARAGYAVAIVYPPNVRHVDRIRRAVERARRAGAGLWDTPAFACTPADYRADRCVARP